MISEGSGVCHGPGCTNPAVGDFCSEAHAQAWHRQFWNGPPVTDPLVQAIPSSTRPTAEYLVQLVYRPPIREALTEAMGAVTAEEAGRNLREALRGIGGSIPVGMGIASVGLTGGSPIRLTVERLTVAIRAVCPPEHLNAAMSEAFRRAVDSPRVEALQSVYDDLVRGWLPDGAGAAKQQVASRDPQVGWLAKLISRLFGRTS